MNRSIVLIKGGIIMVLPQFKEIAIKICEIKGNFKHTLQDQKVIDVFNI